MRALLLAALLLAPLAAADHAYSHRVYVTGRVVDVDGQPAPGLPVNLTFHGLQATGGCFDSKPEVTGPRGDYLICRHAHVIPPDASVTVLVEGAANTVPVDPDLRHAATNVQLKGPAPFRDIGGERTFGRTFTVAGRAFALHATAENAEGVMVNATPLIGNVTIELRGGVAIIQNATAPLDEHGRYQVDLAVDEIPPGAVVRARLGIDVGEDAASASFRRADVNIVRDLRLIDGPGADAPGSNVPIAGWLAVFALALSGVARRRRSR